MIKETGNAPITVAELIRLELAYRMGYIDRSDKLVRCKDCKWFSKVEMWNTDGTTDTTTICALLWDNTEGNELRASPDDFCSWAERQEEDGQEIL